MDSVMYNIYLLDAFLLVSFKKCCLNKVFFPVNVVNVLYYIQYVYAVLYPAIFLVPFSQHGCPNIEPKWFWVRLVKDQTKLGNALQANLDTLNSIQFSDSVQNHSRVSSVLLKYKIYVSVCPKNCGCNPAVILGRNCKNNDC